MHPWIPLNRGNCAFNSLGQFVTHRISIHLPKVRCQDGGVGRLFLPSIQPLERFPLTFHLGHRVTSPQWTSPGPTHSLDFREFFRE